MFGVYEAAKTGPELVRKRSLCVNALPFFRFFHSFMHTGKFAEASEWEPIINDCHSRCPVIRLLNVVVAGNWIEYVCTYSA